MTPDAATIRNLLRLHEASREAYVAYSDCLFSDHSPEERQCIGHEAFEREIDWMNALAAAGYRSVLDVMQADLLLEKQTVPAGEAAYHPEPPC